MLYHFTDAHCIDEMPTHSGVGAETCSGACTLPNELSQAQQKILYLIMYAGAQAALRM